MSRTHKLLFLDFDGVLRPSFEQVHYFSNAPALDSILDLGLCRIVISFSWRHSHSFEELIDRLPVGISKWIIGCT